MATRIELSKKDLSKLKNKFNELHKYSLDSVENSIKHVAAQAVGRMKKEAPVATGRLRREIGYELANKRVTIFSEAIDPETRIDYAPLQEYGSRKLNIPPHPFFYRNIRWFYNALYKDISRKIRTILNKK